MRTTRPKRLFWNFATILTGLLLPTLAAGRHLNQYLAIRQTVACISYIEGSASLARGDDPENWQAADRNVPMTMGDGIYAGNRSRLELQIHGGSFVRLGARTELVALNLTNDTKQFSVKAGVASFQVRRLAPYEIFEIDTPNAAIMVDRPGDFRVDVDDYGNTRVAVRAGQATVAAGGGQVRLRTGEEMDIDGIRAPRYDIVGLGRMDGWDRWVQAREERIARARSYEYISADIVGCDDLDEYGRWEDIPEYGRVWTPVSVSVDWVPYRAGHWIWQDPWGWTWVSAEPWGWAPYHYGRWVVYSSCWYWVPVARRVIEVAYSPALVAFVGGGPGWSASISLEGGGFVGWFPLGPRDPLEPWWMRRADNVNVTNVTYVNRTYVTVVNQNTFVSGGIVADEMVRDHELVQRVVSAPVVRGPLPLVPTQAALRVAVRGDAAPPQPPAQIVERAVVARVAPPPAPPTFQEKVSAIRENRGAPIASEEAAQISVESRGRAEAASPVRPVVAREGQITLTPRGRGRAAESDEAQRPEPITQAPGRGRPLSTEQQPIAPAPVTSDVPQEVSPLEMERGQQQHSPSDSWRRRERPAEVAPVPQERSQQLESREQAHEAPAEENERAVAPPSRRREHVAPPPERSRFQSEEPVEARRAPERGPERQAPPAEDNSNAEQPAETPPEREVQPPARSRDSSEQSGEQKEEKQKREEEKKKDERARKPD